MSRDINDPHPYEQPLLTLALLLVCALLVYSEGARRLDLLAYDSAIQALPTEPSENIVIVSIDEKSLNGIGQWPWRRAIHAQLVDKLNRYNASLIGFDIIFSERDQSYPEDDEILATSIRSSGNVVLPMHIYPLSYGSPLSEILPIPPLLNAAKSLGHVHVELEEDGLARGIYLNSGVGSDHWPALALAMATETNPMIQYLLNVQDQYKAPYMSVKSEFRLIPFAGPRGTYPSYSYLDVMADKVPPEVFRDKVVFVGAAAIGLGDTIPTPVTRQDTPLSGVEFHANAYSSILQRNMIRPVSKTWGYLLTFAFIMIPILVFPRLGPTTVMPATVLLVCGVGGFTYLLLRYDNTWFPPMNAVLGILLAYPLWSWQRMRHLNRFFSQELERLGNEPDLGFRNLGQRSIENIFLSMLGLLKPSQYLFAQNGQVVHCFDKEVFDNIEEYQEGLWSHQGEYSWIQLREKRTVYRIALKWEGLEQRHAISSFLDKLDLNLIRTKDSRRYYEQVSNRIRQVREAIDAMRDMRTFISRGFEEMPGAVIVTDPVGSIVYCNSQASNWIGAPEEELRGRSIIGALETQIEAMEKFEVGIASVLLHGKEIEFELLVGERDMLIHCLPFLVDDKSDAGMMVSMSDISQIRREQREKNQLIDFLSHDVRSPLVSQLAMLQGLRTGRLTWQNSLIDDIEKHAKRSLNLSEQFLQITRAEQISEADFYEFDLLSTIENALDTVTPQAKAKDIRIQMHGEHAVWLEGNAELIERAITNLLSNAIKYSHAESTVQLTLACSQATATLRIQDQGLGIAEEELPYIFDRFRRQRHSETSGEKGAGLGLNFVKVVAEKHGVNLGVQSTLGQGSTFTLEFRAIATDGVDESEAQSQA